MRQTLVWSVACTDCSRGWEVEALVTEGYHPVRVLFVPPKCPSCGKQASVRDRRTEVPLR